MTTKLAVAIIHGMGVNTRPGFADGLVADLRKHLTKAGKDATEVAFKSLYWADITQAPQEQYLKAARSAVPLDFISIREFIVGAFGDASAYQQTGDANNSTQALIHQRIEQQLNDLYVKQLGGNSVPLITIAHSLGCHIISNYIWDVQARNVALKHLSGFEKFWSHAGMITFGCNIPLFTFAHRKVLPIEFPSPRLSPELKALARWYNYYDRDDVLGYPLKPLSKAYAKVVDADIEVNVGGLLSSWNLTSHSHYWEDNSFTKPAARLLADFI